MSELTTFSVENNVGRIVVTEVDGPNLEIEATYNGQGDAELTIDRPRSELIKIQTKGSQETVTSAVGGGTNRVSIGDVSISGMSSGSIVVTGGGSVVINGQTIRAGPGQTVVSVSGGEVVLKLRIPKTLLANFKAESSAGDIAIKGNFQALNDSDVADRQVVLKTMSGDITCVSLCAAGAIKLNTASGDIDLEGIKGPMEIKTMSGDVGSVNGAGQVFVKTMSGDISVTGHSNGHVSAESMSGDIRFNNPNADVTESAKTMSGDVRGMKSADNCRSTLNRKNPFD